MKRGFVLSVLLLLVGCSASVDGRPLAELEGTQEGGEYVVSAGDTLDIQVWGERNVSGEVFVRDDGKFTMPLVGDIAAEGNKLSVVKSTVIKQLSKFIPSASVSVSVVQSAPVRYFLLGSFNKPGEFRSEGAVTFLQAIASGGGFAPFANESSITLIRKTPDGELRYGLDYNQVIAGRQPNPRLKSGDVIAIK